VSNKLGASQSEVLALTHEDIGEYVTFPWGSTKNGDARSVPLSLRARKGVEEIKELLGGDKPFGGITKGVLHYMFKQVRDDLGGLDDVTIHILRHTCSSRLIQGGMEIYHVSKWLGHRDIQITAKRYAHLRPEDLKSGLAILQAVS
jgi:integrase